jgi:hypothetical protein
MKRITVHALVLLTLISCTRNKLDNLVIPVNFSEAINLFESDLLEEIHLVQLETKEESMIRGIDKILIHDQDIFILNIAQPKNPHPQDLFRFSLEGEYLNKYGRVGRGPEEYISIFDFLVSDKTNQVEILTGPVNKVLIYKKDGSIVNQIKITENIRVHSFSKTNSDNYLVCSGANNGVDNYRIQILNKEGEIINRFLGQKTNLFGLVEQNFTTTTNGAFFRESFNDTIYFVDDRSIEPFQVFNFAEYNLPKDVFNLNQETFFQSIKGSAIIFNHLDNGQFMLINFFLFDTEPFAMYSVLKNHRTGNTVLLKPPKLGDTPVESLQAPLFLTAHNEIVFSIQSSDPILNKDIFKKIPQIHGLLERVLLQEDSNPILVFARIRDEF